MIKPKVSLFVFTETKLREDVYLKRKPVADREVKRFIDNLEEVELLLPPKEEIRSKADVLENVSYVKKVGVDAVILLVPIFVSPALVAHAANLLNTPLTLMGNESPDTLSKLSMLACGGAIEQIEVPYKRIPGDIEKKDVKRKLISFLVAATTQNALRGKTYGCFGGRSLGISTGVADPVLWESIFGVDIEHIDQFEIVREAENVEETEVDRYKKWLTTNMGSLNFNGDSFTEEKLELQIKAYIASKKIIKKFELDFIGIKCQPEISNGFILQCLNVGLMNDPYDADGQKEPVVCSCEADADGALTMEILKLISGNQPTALKDIINITDNDMLLANCGSMATYFAFYSKDPKENMKKVAMVPHTFGEAGGGTLQMIAGEAPLTFARLFRKGRKYFMALFSGDAVMGDRKDISLGLWPRPLIFCNIRIDAKHFMETYGSNHVHCTKGDYKEELKDLCELLNVEWIDYDLD